MRHPKRLNKHKYLLKGRLLKRTHQYTVGCISHPVQKHLPNKQSAPGNTVPWHREKKCPLCSGKIIPQQSTMGHPSCRCGRKGEKAMERTDGAYEWGVYALSGIDKFRARAGSRRPHRGQTSGILPHKRTAVYCGLLPTQHTLRASPSILHRRHSIRGSAQ